MKHILILSSLLFIFSCEKEDDINNSSPSYGNVSTPSSTTEEDNLAELPSTSQVDTILAVKKFNNSFYGTYKGVFINGKDQSGYIIIHTNSDTTTSAYININSELIFINDITLNTNSPILASFNHTGEYKFTLIINRDGSSPKLTLSKDNINYHSPIIKETSVNEVVLYKGTWTSEVITPISSFTETGLWNLSINNSTIKGCNNEGLLSGGKDYNILKGSHKDGSFKGEQYSSLSKGTFTWSAFGISGIGNWKSEQVSIKDLLNNL